MITNKTVLAAVSDRWDKKGLFESRWPNLIGTWCVAHYRKYHKAPGQRIENIFDRWSSGREGKDKDTVKLIEKFLASVSGQYEREKKKTQVQFVIDLASEHFNAVKCQEATEEAQGLIEDGRITEALAVMENFKKVEMGMGSAISVLRDKNSVREAFSSKSDPVITFDGALGNFFGNALERDAFISFEGPEKRGKSWILIEMAWQAMKLGKKVAMFQVGDLSKNQIMRRFMIRASGRPLDPTQKGKPLLIPVGIDPPSSGGGVANVVHKEQRYKNPVKWQEAWAACKKITSPWGPNEDLLKLDVYPNTSININGISSVLDSWKRNDGWNADVVIIDYADILAPIDGKIDTRHQIDATWRGMRRISQSNHCLLLTASQTNAASYGAATLSMMHFSEAKSKRAHVNGTVGINQTDVEKKLGIIRFNWLSGRDWDYSSDVCVHCAGCLGMASPLMLSTF